MAEDPSPALVVGIGGKLRSGKDTIADYLVDHHRFRKLNMSTPIDKVAAAINPIIDFNITRRRKPGFWGWLQRREIRVQEIRYVDYRETVGFTKAKEHPEFRGVLQRIGYDAGRLLISDTIWVDMVERDIEAARAEGVSVILSGVRFPNEQVLIHSQDGTLIWVDRPGLPETATGTSHATEVGLDPSTFDVIITNDATLADLYSRAENALDLPEVTE